MILFFISFQIPPESFGSNLSGSSSQNMMLPPPCFSVYMVIVALDTTFFLEIWPKSSSSVSSHHNTFYYQVHRDSARPGCFVWRKLLLTCEPAPYSRSGVTSLYNSKSNFCPHSY
ncbi:hypothetical protein CRENBAI_013649 [Crenichthys baileyi]|uniref:Uncharacterized protein n=1 Tax=Crenichthys baileyi TaxID=28760 RepID=A0AAV9SDS2_9TELE